jgi:hypothetical protein
MTQNLFYRFIALEWSGLLLGGLLAIAGWYFQIGLLASFGVLIGIGNTVHLILMARAHAKFPANGKRVDLGGFRVHVVAEGVANDNYPIVWFSGGHAAGAAMHHLHRDLIQHTRSILIDRPGTGWSDTGPFPRTTAREAE